MMTSATRTSSMFHEFQSNAVPTVMYRYSTVLYYLGLLTTVLRCDLWRKGIALAKTTLPSMYSTRYWSRLLYQ